jgi:selenide,water dikinase
MNGVPYLDGVWELVEEGIVPGGTRRNLTSAEPLARWGSGVGENARLVLCDAQTSGGLLMAARPERIDRLLAELRGRGVQTAAVIGEILPRDSLGGRRIEVTSQSAR